MALRPAPRSPRRESSGPAAIDVVPPVSQRRDVDDEGAEAIEEVLAEPVGGHLAAQVPVARRHHSHVHPAHLGAADRSDCCRSPGPAADATAVGRGVLDLVEEDGPAVGQAEQARVIAGGAGERALHVAEKLALEETFGQRAAVLDHEGVLRARGELVEGLAPGSPCRCRSLPGAAPASGAGRPAGPAPPPGPSPGPGGPASLRPPAAGPRGVGRPARGAGHARGPGPGAAARCADRSRHTPGGPSGARPSR